MHQHLVGDVFATAVEHLFAIFACDGHFVGNDIDGATIEHGYERLQIACDDKFRGYTFGLGKTAYSVVFITHSVAAKEKKRCGAIERAHAKRVGDSRIVTHSIAVSQPTA